VGSIGFDEAMMANQPAFPNARELRFQRINKPEAASADQERLRAASAIVCYARIAGLVRKRF
jgi:hypothetical protein